MSNRNNSIAEPWQYFIPSQLGLSNMDVMAIQRVVGAHPDAKIGRETIYNMCAYIYRNAILKDKGKHWYDLRWYERRH